MNFRILSICCVFLLLLFNVESRLNFPKLLPGRRSSRTDVALVRPLEISSILGRSRKVIGESLWRFQKRKTVVIFAEDSVTCKELRCDLIVDKIHSIRIQTTTKESNTNDSSEELNPGAYNSKGDVFSSLEGMVFSWSIVADDKGGSGDVPTPDVILRFMKFHESSFTAPPHIKSLEMQGKRGNMMLVEALQAGTAVVSVRPADEVYKDIEVPAVKIMVVENFKLTPGLLYILPHGEVKFTVEHFKQGIDCEIAIPSTTYYLEVDDEQVVSLDPSTSKVTGALPGCTELRLGGHDAQITDIFGEPTAYIYVVNPRHTEFSIMLKELWVLEVGAVYYVTLLLFDDSGHKITISETFWKFFSPPTMGPTTLSGMCPRVRPTSSHVLLSMIKKDGGAMACDFVEGKQSLEVLDPLFLNFTEFIPRWSGNQTILQSTVDSDAWRMHKGNLSKDPQIAGNCLLFSNL